MSLLKEEPYITFKPNFETGKKAGLTSEPPTMCRLEQAMQGGTIVKEELPYEDGRTRGRLEGFCRTKLSYDCKCVKLQWENDEKYQSRERVLLDRASAAYERVIGREYWQNAANRTYANWEKFFHAMCCELCNRQHNIRDVGYAHLAEASHADGVDPYHKKERFEDVCRYLDMTPGKKPIPDLKRKAPPLFCTVPHALAYIILECPKGHLKPHGELGHRGKIHA